MKTTATILLMICTMLSQAQSVSTLTPEFNGSGGLSLDSVGNLYIGDFGDFLTTGDGDGIPNNIMVLDTDLDLSVYSTNFIGASGNDFDSNGILYQSDIGSSAIYKIVDGQRTFVTSTGISNPVGIVFDSQDNFYVCNCGNNTIRKVTPEGVSTEFASGFPTFNCPNGITIDEDDNLYVSNFSNGNIIQIGPTGLVNVLTATPAGVTSGASNGHLDYFEPTHTLYIASHASNRIYSLPIDQPTDLQVVAGSGARGNEDGDALTATFSRPNGVAITLTGDSIYINSAIPLTNTPNFPLNPQLIRLITGVQSTVSVETISGRSLDIELFPNPVIDVLNVKAYLQSAPRNLGLRISDVTGKVVMEEEGLPSAVGFLDLSIDVSTLRSGNYLLTILDDRSILSSISFNRAD